jgi:hypothetical protein
MEDMSKNSALITVVTTLLIPFALMGCGKDSGGSSAPGLTPDQELQQQQQQTQGGAKGAGEVATTQPAVKDAPTADPNGGDQQAPSQQASGDGAPSKQQPQANRKHKNMCLDAYDPGHKTPEGLICPVCRVDQISQPDLPVVKLDILFVADTSPSLASYRSDIAKSIGRFVEALQPGTDYRIGVLAAHSDVSYDQKAKPSSGRGGRLLTVLSSKKSGGMTQMTNQLVEALNRMPVDPPTDGGETGLYSLDLAISEPLLSQNRTKDFFRKDASLAVIFVSDENDICADAEDYARHGNHPAKPNLNMYNGQSVEKTAGDFYCRGGNGKAQVNSRSVYAKLRSLERNTKSGAITNGADTLLVSGILYPTDASVPTQMRPDEKYPEYFNEKEIGEGYLTMIELNKGTVADMKDPNVKEGLKDIGKTAAQKFKVDKPIKLGNVKKVDPNTVCLTAAYSQGSMAEVPQVANMATEVDGVSYVYDQTNQTVFLRAVGTANGQSNPSKLSVFYCEPPSVIDFRHEIWSWEDVPTPAEHYRNLPVPNACKTLKSRISSGAFDNM